jgi:hypothetical protein
VVKCNKTGAVLELAWELLANMGGALFWLTTNIGQEEAAASVAVRESSTMCIGQAGEPTMHYCVESYMICAHVVYYSTILMRCNWTHK